MAPIVAETPANSGLLQFDVASLCSRFPGITADPNPELNRSVTGLRREHSFEAGRRMLQKSSFILLLAIPVPLRQPGVGRGPPDSK
jgi:hypothetical protein